MITHVQPPRADKRPVRSVWHGVELVDDYAWLRDDNWREVMRDPKALDPAIRAHLEAENAWTDAALAHTRALQDELYREMRGRIKEDDSTVPLPDGPWDYAVRYVAGGQYPRLVRAPRGGGAEQTMLDGDREAAGKGYWRLGNAEHSPDHRFLAYAVDDKGSELFALRIRDLATGEDLPDDVQDVADVCWADGDVLFYVRLDENQRPRFVWRHVRGTPAAEDALIYEEPDVGFSVDLDRTQSGRFVTLTSHDHQTSEIRLIDVTAPFDPPRLVVPRRTGREVTVEHHGDDLIITENGGAAEDFRICRAPLADPGEENWREIVPHRPGRLIEQTLVLSRHLVRLEHEDCLPRIVVRDWASGEEHAIAFAEEAYDLDLVAGYEFDTDSLRFVYSSMTTPRETRDYDMTARTRVLRKRQEVPSGHEPKDYVTRRIFAPARDGESVPVTLLHRRETPLDGSAPVFLYGYGAYGLSTPASFSTARLSLVDRGFVFAIAHVRGGKDKGQRWRRLGMMAHKTNSFHDFVDAGRHLVARGLTREGRIVAYGGSAGGMLVGAAMNIDPNLFLGVIADVPFVDVLNTMLDASLPLTPPEWLEWGNPIESVEDFRRMRGYSPYDNVTARPYPHVYAYGGLTDPRVTYWEPAKWVARLRELSTSENLILLRTNMGGGHGGASGRFDSLKERAEAYAFALSIAGLDRSGAQSERSPASASA